MTSCSLKVLSFILWGVGKAWFKFNIALNLYRNSRLNLFLEGPVYAIPGSALRVSKWEYLSMPTI